MYSQIRIKRHDEVVHDVEEVWRSLRRALLFLRSNEREQAAAALRFTVGVFNFVDDMDLITKYHLQILFAEMYLILRDEVESGRMYKLSYSSLVKKYGGEHLVFPSNHLFYDLVATLYDIFTPWYNRRLWVTIAS